MVGARRAFTTRACRAGGGRCVNSPGDANKRSCPDGSEAGTPCASTPHKCGAFKEIAKRAIKENHDSLAKQATPGP